MKILSFRRAALAFIAAATLALAQEKPAESSPERARANLARPITLSADDVRAFPEAPAGFKTHDGETWGSNLYHFSQRIFR